MVCLPCFIIPLLLYVWHKFVQPIMLKYWNPWEKKDKEGNVIKSAPEFPFECMGGSCAYVGNKKKIENPINSSEQTPIKSTNDSMATTTDFD